VEQKRKFNVDFVVIKQLNHDAIQGKLEFLGVRKDNNQSARRLGFIAGLCPGQVSKVPAI